MRLARYGEAGHERPALVDGEGRLRDLSAHLDDIDGAALAPESLSRIAALDPAVLPAVPGNPRLGPPVGGIGKIVAVGLNYADHAREGGHPIPDEPVLFLKATTAIAGPDDPILIPLGASKVDWEVELAFVIGTAARHTGEATALAHVAGYCTFTDVSERDFQSHHGGQWTKGKSADSFAPIGPWLVTRDAVPDPGRLALRLEVNGEPMQASNTEQMIFGVPFLVSYISRFMTLAPGDVVITGTPPGVGAGRRPPRFLAPGDVVTVAVEGLGEQRHEVRDIAR